MLCLSFSGKQFLVHIAGAGDSQFCKIEILRDLYPLNPRKGQDVIDADDEHNLEVMWSLTPDNLNQESLLTENIPNAFAGEQTWPTEAEMAEVEEDRKQKKSKKRKLPPGTSEYQAAWILNESDDDDLESVDEEDDGMILDEGDNDVSNKFDFDEDQESLDLGESDAETETDSVMVDGENMTREQLEKDIKRLKDAHAEDEGKYFHSLMRRAC
ncbi:hypothetical protein RND81_03G152600 [Saponaria officinalis]|uniref:Uncharacterized protein n=1 Tax=Saponaria officinalis TaxID=3572 RepID=A0AAW1MB05_SAPOF